MLKRVTLRNFKPHRSAQIDVAPLTVFIGPNNSGKSSVFQGLLLLRQSAMSSNGVLANPVPRHDTNNDEPFLYPPEQHIDLGTFEDIVHSGQQEIGFDIAGEINDADPKMGGRTQLSLDLGFRNNRPVYHKGKLSLDSNLGGRTLPWNWVSGPVIMSGQPSNVEISGRIFSFSVAEYPIMFQFTGISGPGFPDPAQAAEFSALGSRIGQMPRSLLTSVHPVYPLRGLEESGYPVTLYPEAVIDRMMLADRTLSLLSILAYRNDVLDTVSDWLENLIGVRIRAKLVPPRRVTLICERKTGLFSNEGTGASQLPFIFVPIALCPPGETVLLSEPEAHLHPAAQSQLASILLKVVKEGQRQLVIETHSEHMLHTILHSVAKGDLRKEDFAIHYFYRSEGGVNVRRLSIDDLGRVEGGLPGFFDHSLGELSDYLETLQKKS